MSPNPTYPLYLIWKGVGGERGSFSEGWSKTKQQVGDASFTRGLKKTGKDVKSGWKYTKFQTGKYGKKLKFW